MQALSAKSTVARPVQARRASRTPVVVRAAAVSSEVPDMNKRNVMNLLLAGAIGLPVTALAGPFAVFFVPPR